MYSNDFRYVSQVEDDESTIVSFKSDSAAVSLGVPMNIYFSIEGVNLSEAEHIDYDIGTIGGTPYTQDGYVTDLATCILPLISGTPNDD
jgi:hypothetical protein